MIKREIRNAVESDNDSINALIAQTPQKDEVIINFERSPCFFDGSRVATSEPDVRIYKDTDRDKVIGIFSMGSREIYVNGEKRNIRYANDLRIHSDYRGSRHLIMIFKYFREKLLKKEWIQTVILAENLQSIATVGSGRAGLPTYYSQGEIETHIVSTNKRKTRRSSQLMIRRAGSEDIDVMQKFFNKEAQNKQFYPHYEFSGIESNNPYYNNIKLENYFLAFENDNLVGISGIWDQKKFKQTRFVQYVGKMRWIRPIYNIYARLFDGIVLPDPGDILDFIYLHTTVTKNNRADIFEALFYAIYDYCNEVGIKAVVAGFFVNDILLAVIRRFKSKKILSKQYLICYDGDPRADINKDMIPYVEVARL